MFTKPRKIQNANVQRLFFGANVLVNPVTYMLKKATVETFCYSIPCSIGAISSEWYTTKISIFNNKYTTQFVCRI